MPRATASPPARLAVLLAGLLAGLGLLLSLGSSTAAAATPCWRVVLDDWVDNGRFDGVYPPACLNEALRRVPEDIRAYSDFEDRLKQARLDAFRARTLQGAGGAGTPPSPSGTARPRPDKVQPIEPRTGPRGEGPLERALNYPTSDASSIPLPLIVLAALALLLMAAGAAGFAQRKLAARRARSG